MEIARYRSIKVLLEIYSMYKILFPLFITNDVMYEHGLNAILEPVSGGRE